MKQLEKERKFLVKVPTWTEIDKIFDHIKDIKKIQQWYLIQKDKDKPAKRIRKTIEGLSDKKIRYDLNVKEFVSKGVNKEKEDVISEKDFLNYLKDKDPNKIMIKKTRFVFDYKNQLFELDMFNEPHNGLCILEIELKDINDKIDIPNFINVIKEVTGSSEYSNFNLAKK